MKAWLDPIECLLFSLRSLRTFRYADINLVFCLPVGTRKKQQTPEELQKSIKILTDKVGCLVWCCRLLIAWLVQVKDLDRL
jgi:hypothetical protein